MQLNHYQIQLCKIQARLFALAYAKGYDPRVFVPTFMRSPAAAGLDAPFDRLQWAGYLYRYWHFVTGESNADIYRQAPLDVMLDVYPGFHALSPEMAIEDLKRTTDKEQT